MGKALLRDNFDLILLAILEDAPKYGLEIIAEAKSRTDGYFDFKEGSLYPALHRLEKAGFVEAEFAPSTMGGPRRRYYRLTETGIRQLAERREAWERFNGAVGALWGAK
jgi:PadR family transcriptional regulator, regulatory protein PadR